MQQLPLLLLGAGAVTGLFVALVKKKPPPNARPAADYDTGPTVMAQLLPTPEATTLHTAARAGLFWTTHHAALNRLWAEIVDASRSHDAYHKGWVEYLSKHPEYSAAFPRYLQQLHPITSMEAARALFTRVNDTNRDDYEQMWTV
jgi:hypothetical protein